MSEITTKNFKQRLAAIVKSAKSQRDKVQEIIVFGIQHYKDHGNSSYLTMVLNECVGVKSMPTKTIKGFIQEHANLKYVKNDAGDLVFKKDGKEVKAVMPVEKWYDWAGGDHQATKDMDVMVQAKALLTRINKAVKEGHVKNVEEAKKVKEALRGIVLQA